MAQALTARKNITVITHSLHVAQVLVNNPECQVKMPGGRLRRRDSALEGPEAADAMRHFKADVAILSVLGSTRKANCWTGMSVSCRSCRPSSVRSSKRGW